MPGADLLLNSALVSALGWTLVHFLWQGCVIAFVFWLICLLAPKHGSNLRYWSGLAGMLFSLLVMILTFSLSYAPEAQFGTGISPAEAVNPFLVLSGNMPAPIGLLQSGIEPALPWVVALWMLGVLYSSMRTASDWLGVRRLLRNSIEATELQLQVALEELKRKLGVQLAVQLLASSQTKIPMAVGWLRPVIVMPVSVLARLPQDQLEMILAHELGHIRRFDYLFNLLQVILETLLFYHPAISWMSRRVREEREHRCDDLVVRRCGRPATYARALTNLEVMRSPMLATAVPATGGNLLARIRLIIDDDLPGKGSILAQVLLAAVAGLSVAFGAQQGYTLSTELNRVAFSAQLQVSDVQWKTWGQSREVWGQGVMNYARSVQDRQLDVLKIESLSMQHLVEPVIEFDSLNRTQQVQKVLPDKHETGAFKVPGFKSMLAAQSALGSMNTPEEPSLQLAHAVPTATDFQPTVEHDSSRYLDVNQTLASYQASDSSGGSSFANASRQTANSKEIKVKPIKSQPPRYPWKARKEGIEGFVELEFSLNRRGQVVKVEVLDSMPEGVFDKAAYRALSRWVFERDSEPDSRYRQVFDFELREVAKIPSRRRSCFKTGSRTCGMIPPGVTVVWVNSTTRASGGTGIN